MECYTDNNVIYANVEQSLIITTVTSGLLITALWHMLKIRI